MAGIQLKVSPDELRKKAIEIEGQIANAERSWASLCEVIHASKHYWEGDAAEYGRGMLEEIKQDAQMTFQRLKEHPPDLLKMAGIYIDAETKATEMANSLPDNVLA